jgi:hypothetical protein
MKKLVAISCFLLAFAAARPVESATFTISSLSVDLRDHDPGLVLWHSDLLESVVNLSGVGSTDTIDLFTIGTKETAFNVSDDLKQYPISVAFTLNPYTFGGTVEGVSGALWLGYITWNDPITVAFGPGNAGLLQIALSNVAFGLPGAATVEATFTLLRDVPGAVYSTPEPGTLALLGIGVAAALLRRRRLLRG